MEFRILGPLEVVGDEGPISLPRGRARALLALLVLRAGEVVPTDRLVDELWGATPPPTATTALHGLVSTLRRRLEPAGGDPPATVIATRPPGYVLAVDARQVDANRFRALLEQASGAPPAVKAARLREALSMWRGPALADVAYQPFAQATIAALDELRLTAVEERVDADLALGRHAEVVAELEALTAERPLRERPVGQLMLALYRCGRQADALEVYRQARARLVDDLGIDPRPEVQRLHQAILSQDPSLELTTPTAPTEGAQTTLEEPGRWLPDERRTVTVMFVDLTGPPDGPGSSDPEAAQQSMRSCLDAATRTIGRHGGTVEGVIGGVAVAVFGLPAAHEDDALRAARAAAELLDVLAALDDVPHERHTAAAAARIGINTGEVVVGAPDPTGPSGQAVRVAARLQQVAAMGEVLLGESTQQLVAAVARLRPVRRAGPDGATVTAWRLEKLIGDECGEGGSDRPMVGRQSELRRLRTALARAVRDQHGALATVVGEPGIGKTRLAGEFAAAIASEACVLTGRCPAYGEGITFWPLREVVLQAAQAQPAQAQAAQSIVAQLSAAIGPGRPAGRPDALFPSVRRFFEAFADPRPAVVVLDDAHWAQPTLLDLVEYLAATTEAAVLLVCVARPEFREQRPHWLGEREDATSLSLTPLDAADSRKLVEIRPAGQPLPPETVAQVLATARGNPLFIEQLLAALRHDGQLAVTASLQALLAARLDRLGPAERDLLRSAAVIGTDVPVDALTALVPDAARRFVHRHLQRLADKELIGPVSRSDGTASFSFGHVLIQDAAYRSITRRARSELHHRLAGWYEQHPERSGHDHDAVVGYHLEQAHEQRCQLGLVDEHTRRLALGAGERLAAAGLRAYARFDVAATENLLSRARGLLPQDHPRRWEIIRPLPEVYQVLGRHRAADSVLDEMLATAGPDSDELRRHRIRLERARIELITARRPRLAVLTEQAGQALESFERGGDDAGMALHSYVLGLVHLRRGELSEMEAVARRGLAHAERARQPRDEAATRWWVALALVEGVTPVEECIRQCNQLLGGRGDDRHPGVLAELARLHAMRGDCGTARELLADARRLFHERIRGRRPLIFLAQRYAEVEIIAGDVATAEDELRSALALASDIGEPEPTAQVAAELAILLARRGAVEEAAGFAQLAQAQAPTDSVTAHALARAAAARVAVCGGDFVVAEQCGVEAAGTVPAGMPNLRARLHVQLAATLLGGGQRDGAAAALAAAVDLYNRKGNAVGMRSARELAAAAPNAPY